MQGSRCIGIGVAKALLSDAVALDIRELVNDPKIWDC